MSQDHKRRGIICDEAGAALIAVGEGRVVCRGHKVRCILNAYPNCINRLAHFIVISRGHFWCIDEYVVEATWTYDCHHQTRNCNVVE